MKISQAVIMISLMVSLNTIAEEIIGENKINDKTENIKDIENLDETEYLEDLDETEYLEDLDETEYLEDLDETEVIDYSSSEIFKDNIFYMLSMITVEKKELLESLVIDKNIEDKIFNIKIDSEKLLYFGVYYFKDGTNSIFLDKEYLETEYVYIKSNTKKFKDEYAKLMVREKCLHYEKNNKNFQLQICNMGTLDSVNKMLNSVKIK